MKLFTEVSSITPKSGGGEMEDLNPPDHYGPPSDGRAPRQSC